MILVKSAALASIKKQNKTTTKKLTYSGAFWVTCTVKESTNYLCGRVLVSKSVRLIIGVILLRAAL